MGILFRIGNLMKIMDGSGNAIHSDRVRNSVYLDRETICTSESLRKISLYIS